MHWGQVVALRSGDISSAWKTTGWRTTILEVAEELAALQCPNRSFKGDKELRSHVHERIVHHLAKVTDEYTPELVHAILRGIVRYFHRIGVQEIGHVGVTGHEPMVPLEDYEEIYDEMTGKLLPAEEVRYARIKEFDYLQ